jgi:alkyl sulfatase BDS1-like metallo-beta-lactamase superfamily hydrolase
MRIRDRFAIPVAASSFWTWIFCAVLTAGASAQEVERDVHQRVDDLQDMDVAAVAVNDFVYRIEGEGAFFLINTSEGSVLVDTGTPYAQNELQMKKVEALASGPIRKVILTHAHSDHSGGLPRFEEAIEAGEVEFVAHQRYAYMARLQDELLPYFKKRYHVLYPTRVSLEPEPPRPYWNMKPTRPVFPGSDYRFELGGVEFVVIAPENGGEGEDGLLVWLPESRILFTGDLFGTLYPMFPNLYTVRGEKYRDPLDYIDALDLVLELKPEVIAHSHFRNAEGEAYIQASVRRMRDAVQYMWDEVVKGMNGGKTVWELMRDIRLPEHLALSQGHGKVSWSVRAAWEIIAGWYYYDTIANLYHVPPTAVNDDLLELAGGADRIAERARRHLEEGRPLEAIRLLDIAAGHETEVVLDVRIGAVERLLEEARDGLGNYSEIGLLEADLRSSRAQRAVLSPAGGAGQPSRDPLGRTVSLPDR